MSPATDDVVDRSAATGATGAKAKAAASPIALICGAGSIPYAVADAVQGRGRSVYLLAIKDWADPQAVKRYPHAWVAVGQIGRVLRLAREAGCRDLVCVGALVRPALRSLKLDWTTVRLLPRLYRLFRGGDDHLLAGVGGIFEEMGFRLLGPHEVAPEILAPGGSLGSVKPSARDLADAALGFEVVDAIGRFDIGQAAVVADRRVLALEAAEGTDAMLARVVELRRQGKIGLDRGVGVLVKAPKPNQDRRLDLPAIGPETVKAVVDAGLGGIAVRAGMAIVAEPQALSLAADRAGIFVVGVPIPGCDQG